MIKGDCAKARKGLEVRATFGILRMLWNGISRLGELFYVYNCFIMFVLYNACMWCFGMIKTFIVLMFLEFFQKSPCGIEGPPGDA